MRIAVVYDSFPWPVRSGDNKRIDQFIAALRRRGHHVHLLSTVLPLADSRSRAQGKVDALTFHYPRTMRNRVRVLKRHLDFWAEKLGLPTPEDLLVWLFSGKVSAQVLLDFWKRCPLDMAVTLADLVQREGIEAVIVQYAWMAPSIDCLPSDVLRVIDVHDLQFRRVEEFRSIGKQFPLDIDEAREMAIYDRFDLAIAIQHDEAELLRSNLRRAGVIVVGFAYYQTLPPAESGEPCVLYVGGYNEANSHGIRRFLLDVWPDVRSKVANARLRIVGHVRKSLMDTDLPAGVEVLGFVEDTVPLYMAAHVVVNPIWIGTGLKIKTVEGIGYGRAVVTTTKGIEGVQPVPLEACVVVDEPVRMTEELVRLLAEPQLRRTVEERARQYAQAFLSEEGVYAEFFRVIDGSPRGR